MSDKKIIFQYTFKNNLLCVYANKIFLGFVDTKNKLIKTAYANPQELKKFIGSEAEEIKTAFNELQQDNYNIIYEV